MGAWVGAALAGLSGIAGLFGSKKQTSDTTSSSTSTPNYDPLNQSFRDQLIDMYKQRISGAGQQQFQDAYTTGGLKNINTSQANASQAISDMLTSRGLGRTTAGTGTLGDVAESGANQTANFLNTIPLVMDQRQSANLAAAGGYQASLPVGQTVNSSSHTVGTTAPSSPVAGLLGGLAQGGAAALGTYNANSSFSDFLKKLGAGSNAGAGLIPTYTSDNGAGSWG